MWYVLSTFVLAVQAVALQEVEPSGLHECGMRKEEDSALVVVTVTNERGY
jgi:hypothetical protein